MVALIASGLPSGNKSGKGDWVPHLPENLAPAEMERSEKPSCQRQRNAIPHIQNPDRSTSQRWTKAPAVILGY